MPKLTIRPSLVLLTSGQAATLEAVDDSGNPAVVSWDFSPAMGSLSFPKAPPGANAPAAAAGTPQAASADGSRSATYIAPLGASSQTVSIIASSREASGSATICLTPDAMSIIPGKVELKPNQEQQFVAIVAGVYGAEQPPPSNEPATSPTAPRVKWVLSPPFGTLDEHGRYKAPADVPDTATINITAACETTGKQATATVNLTSPPWTGRGVQLLAAYLLLVFTLVFLIVGLWPPALPSGEVAKADRIEAEDTLRLKNDDLDKTEAAWAEQEREAQDPPNSAPRTTNSVITRETRDRVRQAVLFAQQDLEKKRSMEDTVNRPYVETKMGVLNRELDLLWLVMLAGCLGTFLHTSQSFSDYVGNRTLKNNWAWWYYLRPFIGAGLAVVFYTALRGGVIAIATGTNARTSDLNPFGVVATAALVGMFSKAATMKLGEVFETLFKSDKAQATKDKLVPAAAVTQTSAAGTGAATTALAAATK